MGHIALIRLIMRANPYFRPTIIGFTRQPRRNEPMTESFASMADDDASKSAHPLIFNMSRANRPSHRVSLDNPHRARRSRFPGLEPYFLCFAINSRKRFMLCSARRLFESNLFLEASEFLFHVATPHLRLRHGLSPYKRHMPIQHKGANRLFQSLAWAQ
jgi:hypothetical protein